MHFELAILANPIRVENRDVKYDNRESPNFVGAGCKIVLILFELNS